MRFLIVCDTKEPRLRRWPRYAYTRTDVFLVPTTADGLLVLHVTADDQVVSIVSNFATCGEFGELCVPLLSACVPVSLVDVILLDIQAVQVVHNG